MLNAYLLSTLFEKISLVWVFNAHINYFNILLIRYKTVDLQILFVIVSGHQGTIDKMLVSSPTLILVSNTTVNVFIF
jgi:hypothetical protein